ncbi:hypothetical protein CDAR_534151 [Caerostris darwini]|uniref:Uncharacterized protein n=1 Tax=Caerostris darwini TaxID=1538125 RepID=A0AAV4S970_9ARAC|nr:hypothetical protein CDAR_534151 [Caerostris darwini]
MADKESTTTYHYIYSFNYHYGALQHDFSANQAALRNEKYQFIHVKRHIRGTVTLLCIPFLATLEEMAVFIYLPCRRKSGVCSIIGAREQPRVVTEVEKEHFLLHVVKCYFFSPSFLERF